MNSFFHLALENKFDRRGLKSWPFVSFEIEDSRIPIKYKPMSNQAKRKRKRKKQLQSTNNQQQTTNNREPTTDNKKTPNTHPVVKQNKSNTTILHHN